MMHSVILSLCISGKGVRGCLWCVGGRTGGPCIPNFRVKVTVGDCYPKLMGFSYLCTRTFRVSFDVFKLL